MGHDAVHDHLRGFRRSEGERVARNSCSRLFHFTSYVFEYYRRIRIINITNNVVVGWRWKLLRRQCLGNFEGGGAPWPGQELHGVARRRPCVKRVGSPWCGSLLFHFRVKKDEIEEVLILLNECVRGSSIKRTWRDFSTVDLCRDFIHGSCCSMPFLPIKYYSLPHFLHKLQVWTFMLCLQILVHLVISFFSHKNAYNLTKTKTNELKIFFYIFFHSRLIRYFLKYWFLK